MHWYVPDPEQLGAYVLVSCVGLPLAHLSVRWAKRKTVTLGRFVDKVVLGASAPVFVFLAFSPIEPSLLTKISEQQYLLCMTGVIGLALCVYSVFDNNP